MEGEPDGLGEGVTDGTGAAEGVRPGVAEAMDVGLAGGAVGGEPEDAADAIASDGIEADGLAAATSPADPNAPPRMLPTAIAPASATTTSAPMLAGVRAKPPRRASGLRWGRGSPPPGALSMMVRRYAGRREGTAEQ